MVLLTLMLTMKQQFCLDLRSQTHNRTPVEVIPCQACLLNSFIGGLLQWPELLISFWLQHLI